MVQKWATKRELKVPRNALTGKGINLPAWRFPAIGSVLPSVSISAQGASICITSSCAFKQEDLWSYDWSMTIVMQNENTLRYDVSTCFDFLFWEIESTKMPLKITVGWIRITISFSYETSPVNSSFFFLMPLVVMSKANVYKRKICRRKIVKQQTTKAKHFPWGKFHFNAFNWKASNLY